MLVWCKILLNVVVTFLLARVKSFWTTQPLSRQGWGFVHSCGENLRAAKDASHHVKIIPKKCCSPARLDLHESGSIGQALKRTSTAKGIRFFNFSSEYLKRLQSSEPLHTKKMPLILLLVRMVFIILSSYWLVHFYLMKKSAKVLHYLGLDCGMLEFFNHEP